MLLEFPSSPGDDGLRLNEDESPSPIRPEPREPGPEDLVSRADLKPMARPLENQNLMSQGEDLSFEGCAGSEHTGYRAEDENEEVFHGERRYSRPVTPRKRLPPGASQPRSAIQLL